MPDIDGDKVGDFAVGQPRFPKEGSLFVYSGKTGKLLYFYIHNESPALFAHQLSYCGDVDGDGKPDLVVAAPDSRSGGWGRGAVHVFSLAKRRILRSDRGRVDLSRFGLTCRVIGDVDLDRVPDYAATISQDRVVEVRSGKTGQVLRSFSYAAHLRQRFGAPGDVNGDGRADLAIAAIGTGAVDRGEFRVLSPFDGATIHAPFRPDSERVTAVGGVGDFDVDGVGDIGFATTGRFVIVSGKSGRRVYERVGATLYERIVGGADMTGDSVDDFILGVPSFNRGRGYAIAFSSRSRSLSAGRSSLSLEKGGSQDMALRATSAHGSKFYLILGSASGDKPGIALGAAGTLPLNADAWFEFTLANPNVLPLVATLGRLNSSGGGLPSFRIPPMFEPGLRGTQLHHAAVVFNRSLNGIDFLSTSCPLRLER